MPWVACPMLRKLMLWTLAGTEDVLSRIIMEKWETLPRRVPKEKGTIELPLSKIHQGNGWGALYWLLNSPGYHKLSQWRVHTLHVCLSSWPNQGMTINCSGRVHLTTWCSFLLIWCSSSLILTLTPLTVSHLSSVAVFNITGVQSAVSFANLSLFLNLDGWLIILPWQRLTLPQPPRCSCILGGLAHIYHFVLVVIWVSEVGRIARSLLTYSLFCGS